MRGPLIAGLLVLTGAGTAADFAYDPKPRWADDPETEVVCAAIRAECPSKLKEDELDVEWSYAEIYDADGKLVGLRSLQSTGCKPLDEHLLLSHRHFVTAFSAPGRPDLDNITAELAPGTPNDSVRLIKRGATQVSFGC
jgi:hypothetical protein